MARGILNEGALPRLPEFIQAEIDWLPEGPTSIESRYDDAIAVPLILDRVRKAAQEGVDGVVINCFMDPGLQAARELVRIPVAGPAQSAMLLAAGLGQTFSVILPASSGTPIVVDQATVYGVRERLASVRSVGMPVAELVQADRLVAGLLEQAGLAVSEDGAHSIILGCTGMSHVTERVKSEFAATGFGAPVLDPTLAAIGALLGWRVLGVAHSEKAYESPEWRRPLS
ncbi:MAG: aspartate/glutamate racemase family protein [Thermoleophilia bacterium]|nr:aspartate/glutamate racemase family protein [Thermoleophilia bacterium]